LKCCTFIIRQGFLTLTDGQKKPVSCQVNGEGDSASSSFIDLTMVGILVVLGLMFIVICVVLQMFAKAQFSENRSIFNTPNPRLMNVSIVKGSENDAISREKRKNTRSQQKKRARVARTDTEGAEQDMV